MISELLEMIDSLPEDLFFYLEDGALKNKLVEAYMEREDAHAEIREFELNASLRLRREAGSAPAFDCRLEANDFQYRIILAAGDFEVDEITELVDLLKPQCPITLRKESKPARNIIRKKKSSELLNISAATKALALSRRALKRLIPCSATRIVEEDGDKTIKEYYWDQVLIGRFASLWLKHQAGRGYNREDLSFIAQSCCDGDRRWAHDCIVGFLNQRKLYESDSRE